jgi:hypothetical protein
LSYVKEEVVALATSGQYSRLEQRPNNVGTLLSMAIEQPGDVSGCFSAGSVDALAVTGDIITAGSSTVFP